MLSNNKIKLRKPEPEDLEFLYKIENNPLFWFVSETKAPYSKWQLKQHIENSVFDIFTNKELRLIVENYHTKEQLGIVDLFDYDPANERCGIGVVIEESYQGKGIASDAIEMCINYCFNILDLNQIWCNISLDNEFSIKLFTKFGFSQTGVLKKWKKFNGVFVDIGFYQLLNSRRL